MKQTFNFSEYIEQHHNRGRQRWTAGVLGCFAAFFVAFALAQPASTMEQSCGIEEHTHSDSCYTHQTTAEVTTLTCGFTTHAHEEACAGTCGYADFAIHSHSEFCYQDGTLVCTLPEILPHAHDETCYGPAHSHTEECYAAGLGELNCGLEIQDAHAHGEDCYRTQTVCTPEDPQTHIHEESCYASTLVCLLEETQGHAHTELCYTPVQNLICTEDTEALVLTCGLQEITLHTHTEECFSLVDGETVLTCPLVEVLRHDHDETCTTVTTVPADLQVLTCTTPEHTHTEECRPVQAESTAAQAQTEPSTAETLTQTESAETQTQETQPQAAFFALRPCTTLGSGTFASTEGTEGNELSWEMIQYTLTGEYVLTISGKGTMPAFTEGSAPWYKDYNEIRINLVLEDGLNNVGTYAFYEMDFDSITFGSTIKSIDDCAFQRGNGPSDLFIPGNIKKIGNGAFTDRNYLYSVTLSEGLETVGYDAFPLHTITSFFSTVQIPSTVEEIGVRAFGKVGSYTVDPNNQHYCAVDGVLYNKDVTTLIDYPKYLAADTYRIPNTVSTINQDALTRVQNVHHLYIPSSVQNTSVTNFCSLSNWRSIYVEDGATLGVIDGSVRNMYEAFKGCSYLTEVRLPEDIPYYFNNTFSASPNLRHLDIPSGTGLIYNPGNGIYQLRTVSYNARKAVLYNNVDMLVDSSFDLTIGNDVDKLSFLFLEFTEKARSIRFEGPNYITIDHDINQSITKRAFQDAPAPFRGLSGDIYIDAQGVVYTLDKTTLTASVYCVQPGSTEVTIPAAISGEDGTVYTVTSVRTDALKYAGQLQSISFAAPESITDLQALALANCPSLTQVGDKTTVEEASALFLNARLGYHLFYNTSLSGAPESSNFSQEMQGSENLDAAKNGAGLHISVVTDDGKSPPWTPGENNTCGGYRLLTNQTVTFAVSVESTQAQSESRYRVYFRFTDSSISHSMLLGKRENITDSSDNLLGFAYYYTTEDPYTIYAEISPPLEGSTLGISLHANYPNGTAGGGLTVWGVIVDGNAAPGIMEPESPENTIQVWWDTQADDFALTSQFTTASTVGVIGDNAGSGKPSENLQWTVALSRATETTSSDGKDYVQQADLESIFTLPKDVQWHPDILEALNAGVPITFRRDNYDNLFFSVRDISVAAISLSIPDQFFRDLSIDIESSNSGDNSTGGSATFRWTVLNKTGNAEINTTSATFTVYASALQIKSENLNDLPSYFTSESTASVSYSFRDDAVYSVDPETGEETNGQLHASASRAISGGSSNASLAVTSSYPRYFGEDITYTTRLYNDGALTYKDTAVSDTTGYTIHGVLPKDAYIKPENMERMFDPDTPAVASITIEHAFLGKWDSISGVDGSTVNLHPGNSDIGAGNHTLTITKTNAEYQVAVTGGETYRSEDLSVALKNAGFAVTANTVYSCLWQLNEPGTVFTLSSGESQYFYVYATIKDSFQTITDDYQEEYPPNSLKESHYEAFLSLPSTSGRVSSNSVKVCREASIHKSVSCNEQVLTDFSSINDGDVLDYQLTFTHYGSGTPTDLPFVDDLYGTQYLLVPSDLNPGLSHLQKHGQYYILSEGVYTNIVVGVDDDKNPLTAASVTVRSASSVDSAAQGEEITTLPGLHTHIEWYFSELPQGFYQMVISYSALVDMRLTGVDYTIGNTIYLNNRTETHLYDTILGGGTLLDFSLDILETPGDAPASDVKDGDGYTLISPGEAVNYRATISSDQDLCLPGGKLAIGLPHTFDLFNWELGVNVTDLRIETENGVTITENDGVYIANGYAEFSNDRQFILWPEGSEISFDPSSTLYIYFTLTYPSDTQTYARTSSDSLWDRYSDALRGSPPEIDLFLYSHPDSVQHDLKEPGAVLLQKGVLGTYLYRAGYAMKPTASRLYFNNRDSWERAVTYYVVLYNGDNKWLYVEDMYDQLPAGFTFLTMLNSNGSIPSQNTSSIATSADGKFDLLNVEDPNVSFRSAVITANTSQGLTFQISADSTNHTLHYDEQKQQYYLEQGEALAFAYICTVGDASQTQEKAVNQIVMPYADDSDTGVSVLSKQDVAVQAAQSPHFSDENDGTRISAPAQDFPNLPDTGHDTLLVSQVTLQRGSIDPGVIKSTVSYQQDLNATPSAYATYAPHNAIVNWQINLYNSGTLSMSDYTLTDVMPRPYSFVGNVSCTLFDGKAVSLISIPQHTIPKDTPLEEIPLMDKTLEVTDLTDPARKTYNLVIGGEPVKMGVGGYTFCVSLDVDDRSNEVLSIQFEGLYWTIPEGEYMHVFLSGVNATGSFFYSVFTNQAYLVPSQKFSSVSQGSMVRDSAGQPTAARNADSVTVSTSHSTSSQVSVTQICSIQGSGAQESHTAISGADRNFIVLDKDNPNFTYTLQVTNDTDRAMTKLVLINNLPQKDDHSPFNTGTERGSEFTVSLADANIAVMIEPKTGEAYTATDYQIQFSTGTNFGGSDSVHWRGETPDASDLTQWTDDFTGARSIRIILKESVPAGASVVVTFHAVAPNNLDPGQTAWNNFGYHYRLEGDYVELEAMPPVVGVKSPTIPSLTKKVLDINGNPILLAQDTQFTFVVCEGSLPGDTFTTAEELASLLKTEGKDYRILSLPMEAGSSVSSPLRLAFDNWHWREGQTYTVLEILEDNAFTFHRFLGTGTSFYTFSYDPAVQQQVLCENTLNHWSIELTKTDPMGSKLEDAVFGLYSPNAADQISGQGFGAPDQVTYNGSTWYLSHIGTTDGQGSILWNQLERSCYYLLEIQPPPGHIISEEPGRLLYRSAAEEGVYRVSVVNVPGYELLKTGSIGTTPITLLGLMLMAAAILAFLSKKKASY